MAVETFDGGTMITGEHIRMFQLHAQLRALGLECKGMTRGGRSAMTICNEILVAAGKPRKGTRLNVYKAFRKYMTDDLGIEVHDERTMGDLLK